MLRKSDEQLVYVEAGVEANNNMPQNLIDSSSLFKNVTESDMSVSLAGPSDESAIYDDNDVNKISHWTRNDILALINLYSSHRKYFENSTVKNDKVWQMIATNLKSHTAAQCKNKFKYLKSKYVEKKDLMSTRHTGKKNIKFQYFDEFEDLFGKDHNVTPSHIASSSRSRGSEQSASEEDDEITPKKRQTQGEDDDPKIKKKKTMLQKQLAAYDQRSKEREAAKQKRHDEVLQRQDRALDILEAMNTNLAQFLQKK